MKISRRIKLILIVSLPLVMIASYFINKSNQQTKPINKQITGQETVDVYNRRKKEEVKQQRLKEEKAAEDAKSVDAKKLTIDGYDPATGDIIDPINLWGNYQTRTYAGKLRHGEMVTLIKREGDGVFIEKRNGLKGWVTYFFIKEFNDEAGKRGDK